MNLSPAMLNQVHNNWNFCTFLDVVAVQKDVLYFDFKVTKFWVFILGFMV